MRIRIVVLTIALLMGAAALAADVTGTWTGSLATPGGEYALTYTFHQDGAKLTGTLQTEHGDNIEIADGKVEGNKISFNFEANYNGGMKFANEGSINGDEITLSTKHMNGGEFSGTTTLKREK
jgi:hypothetical protein